MKTWRQRLYESYLSTGQATHKEDQNNPYHKRLIQEHLPKDKKIAILDLACGHGALIASLKNEGYHDLLGIDHSSEQVALAYKLGISEVRKEDLNLFLEGSRTKRYDLIFLMDILEHLEKQEVFDVLDRVNLLLNDGGMVVIHVPNAAGIFGMRIRYGDFTHQNAFTPQSVKQVLHACGLGDVSVFEDKPVIHGIKSFVRYLLWQMLTAPLRLLLIAETGTTRHILSQNILVISRRSL